MNSFGQRIIWGALSLLIFSFIVMGVIYVYLERQLPSEEALENIQLQTPLRVYTSDKKLISEYGKRRMPVAYNEIPKTLVNAVLATEDRRFFEHSGVDLIGIARAAVALARTGQKTQGGSTITMQVARNFLLNNKKTYLRKINEIILAMQIDQKFSKTKILELYLNKIYFGNSAYGVAAAADVYYGKKLSELTLPEMAMLAGLPQAPSAHNPIANPKSAKTRRNHVLFRMFKEGMIDENAYIKAIATPLTEKYHGRMIEVEAPYVAEMIRQAMYEKFGQSTYTHGYKVYTTINSKLQTAANKSLETGLLNYDRRHPYRGPSGHIDLGQQKNLDDWFVALRKFPTIHHLYPAMLTQMDRKTGIGAISVQGSSIHIPVSRMNWHSPLDTLKQGDIIYVQETAPDEWSLAQIPQVQGALVALNPQNGAIEALDGGFDFYIDSFNHVTQAMRQTGSAFKPFFYSAALDKGYTLASVINDAPVVISEPGQPVWRPQNDTKKFYGPTRLRVGLTKSQNLVAIRLLEAIGIPYTLQYVERFGFLLAQLPQTLSLALGTADATPMQMTTAFAVFANGGYKVEPYLINYVTDQNNHILLKANAKTACPECDINPELILSVDHTQYLSSVISPQTAYLMTSVLHDVTITGTGGAANSLKRYDLAGKTGTSNDQKDAWFAGYNPKIAVTAWVGFSKFQKSLKEHGSKAALPIWMDFMRSALAGTPNKPFAMPPGIVTAKIDPRTGLLASPGQKNAITEVFQEGHLPTMSNSNDAQEMNGNSPYGPAGVAEPIF
jgi:penicillin-binding protein 1A